MADSFVAHRKTFNLASWSLMGFKGTDRKPRRRSTENKKEREAV
jgi:hypothetical protein